MTTLPFSGAVLAGGESHRMGRSKARLTVDRQPLLHRQLRLLHQAGASELWVSLHPKRPETIPEDLPVGVVVDAVPNAGPLAGLERLLAVANHPFLMVIAVDLPCLKPGFLRHLLDGVSPGVGLVPEREGHLEPLAAVYPRSAHAVALAHLLQGRGAVRQFAETGLAAGWLRTWKVPPEESIHLTNWNHPGDFRPR